MNLYTTLLLKPLNNLRRIRPAVETGRNTGVCFFAVLSKEFPLHVTTEKEKDLQQQINDLKKENEIYQKILASKLGQ